MLPIVVQLSFLISGNVCPFLNLVHFIIKDYHGVFIDLVNNSVYLKILAIFLKLNLLG